MTNKKLVQPWIRYLNIILVALGAGFTAAWWIFSGQGAHDDNQATREKDEPLYWVAPMDPEFKRDKPGKSPMGMDLVPVYANDKTDLDMGPGTVEISPAVVNNLGVRTHVLTRGKLTPQIHTVGYIKFDEEALVHIHPRVSGWIDALYVNSEGDSVEQGAPLYTLYSPELVNAQEEFLLALRRDNAPLIQAARERLKALQLTTSFIEKLEREREVEQSVSFFAPQSGVVDHLGIREGFYVEPGTTLMSIGALEQVWVEAEVFERQGHLVTPGAEATMRLDFLPDRIWRGTVDYIYPALDPKTRTVRVRIRIDNGDKALKPDMFAQIEIQVQPKSEAILLPREALIRSQNQDRVVLALGDGRFKSIAVRVGSSDADHFEILSGLQAGDEVVTSAQFLLDSESARHSDFQRMQESALQHGTEKENVQTAEVTGVINAINVEERLLNISRDAIKKWNRAPATMDFQVADDVPIGHLSAGTMVWFRFEISQGEFIIMDIKAQSPGAP